MSTPVAASEYIDQSRSFPHTSCEQQLTVQTGHHHRVIGANQSADNLASIFLSKERRLLRGRVFHVLYAAVILVLPVHGLLKVLACNGSTREFPAIAGSAGN